MGWYNRTGADATLTLHWNGSAWSQVMSPNFDQHTYLHGVTGSGNDVWAVGNYGPLVSPQTLILHWNVGAWDWFTSPNPSANENYLYGVTGSGNDAWAVGYYGSPGSYRTLAVHWNGSAWSQVTSPNPDNGDNSLYGVTGSGSDVWAVGYSGSNVQSLTIHYASACSTPTATGAVPTSTRTGTPIPTTPTTATATSQPSSTTPTSVPTACSIQYPDVPPGSTFYPYVHCLACRGIISGYPNGTFGPSNPVTRGQLSKIVSNSAGYTETFSTNTFEDVPLGSTFFPYVERLFLHGGIGGYPCGGAGEPCNPPANKPYFRPGALVTRGQTSKIVAIAKGLPAPSPGQQTFEDVAPNSTFWQWIEPLAATGAIGGYPCGGVGEPCNPPLNRPYFRPGANVTRGQSAKIVSNTFFPNCSTPARPGK